MVSVILDRSYFDQVLETHWQRFVFHVWRTYGAISTNLLGSKYQMYVETYRGRVTER